MRRKEALFAVIGGIVGAVLVMVVGSFSPLGAQTEAKDAEFNTITCRELQVVDSTGSMDCLLASQSGVGIIMVFGKDWRHSAALVGGSNGGTVRLSGGKEGHLAVTMESDEDGGNVTVYNKGGESRVIMGVNEHGNGAVSTWDKNGYRLANLK